MVFYSTILFSFLQIRPNFPIPPVKSEQAGVPWPSQGRSRSSPTSILTVPVPFIDAATGCMNTLRSSSDPTWVCHQLKPLCVFYVLQYKAMLPTSCAAVWPQILRALYFFYRTSACCSRLQGLIDPKSRGSFTFLLSFISSNQGLS